MKDKNKDSDHTVDAFMYAIMGQKPPTRWQRVWRKADKWTDLLVALASGAFMVLYFARAIMEVPIKPGVMWGTAAITMGLLSIHAYDEFKHK